MNASDTASKPNTQRKLFFGLFVFPLLIAVGMAVLLCGVVFLTHEQESPESLITAIKTGSPSRRWQKAYELSNELNHRKENIRSEGLVQEMIHILEDVSRYDPKTRSYMALALSHFGSAVSQAALTRALGDPSEDVQLYALWALGAVKAGSSAPAIMPFLKNEKESLKKTAAYVLGAIGSREALPHLRPLLNDKVTDVRWNAALALARLGDPSGLPLLLQMLERQSLLSAHAMSEEEVENIMINAIKGIALVGDTQSFESLRKISRTDKSLKVRQAALDVLSARQA
ncbi:MAG: hypothetical protein A3C47_03770 [Omnitrophica bacterium RIFCSPHIGHO2_02_FULL_51_18]|nr:MAG: hypothetical protein A3C47_03770 [Omnitrophica bacterium RIFCSPHIGHO2_02_FULL_51_18]